MCAPTSRALQTSAPPAEMLMLCFLPVPWHARGMYVCMQLCTVTCMIRPPLPFHIDGVACGSGKAHHALLSRVPDKRELSRLCSQLW